MITRQYTEWLGIDLWFQKIDEELENFEAMYGPPHGVFLLGLCESELAGGVGLRYLDAGICEMKRLYVFDAFKGQSIGRRICEELIQTARELGYGKMRLDTLRTMLPAQKLYESLGFREIEAYCFNPEPGAVYLELDLNQPDQTSQRA